jgi:hypothetical protein
MLYNSAVFKASWETLCPVDCDYFMPTLTTFDTSDCVALTDIRYRDAVGSVSHLSVRSGASGGDGASARRAVRGAQQRRDAGYISQGLTESVGEVGERSRHSPHVLPAQHNSASFFESSVEDDAWAGE